jgi:hypothetical protein
VLLRFPALLTSSSTPHKHSPQGGLAAIEHQLCLRHREATALQANLERGLQGLSPLQKGCPSFLGTALLLGGLGTCPDPDTCEPGNSLASGQMCSPSSHGDPTL